MKLFKFLTVALIAGVTSCSLSAQDQNNDKTIDVEQFAKRKADLAYNSLKLSEKQYQKVYDLYKSDIKARIKAADENDRIGVKPMREMSDKYQNGFEKKMKKILDDKQFEKYQRFQEFIKKGPMGGFNPHHHGMKPGHGGFHCPHHNGDSAGFCPRHNGDSTGFCPGHPGAGRHFGPRHHSKGFKGCPEGKCPKMEKEPQETAETAEAQEAA